MESNVKHIEACATESSIGKADAAKACKAILNRAEKPLSAKLSETERGQIKTFIRFKIKNTEKIKAASAVQGRKTPHGNFCPAGAKRSFL